MKTLPLSALARQFRMQKSSFALMNPRDWLVWESGPLIVPRENVSAARTIDDDEDIVQAEAEDPLCFEMPDLGEGGTFTVGRAEGNDLVLSDQTVSRHHCTLVRSGKGWMISSAEEGHGLVVDGKKIAHGTWAPVSCGQKIVLGHLRLSLQNAHGLMLRFARAMKLR